MTRLLALGTVLALAAWPAPAQAASYGDPPGWCTRFSDMWTATVVTNDPEVGTNPERDTFYGFHPDPGYDDWYGYFYGDFRGRPGDASGWVKLLHENYPDHYSWNFASNGWAVHGHARQYIAYYNWTFGGQCGVGWYGSPSPPPFMADQYGWPIVDIYVDAMPPYAPQPRVLAATPTSVTFTWGAVADRGDGAGRDFFEAGMDHYSSWVTTASGTVLQLANTPSPRTVTQALTPGQTACLHVQAFDRLRNASPDAVVCGQALGSPPMPAWNADTRLMVAPPRVGLAGFDTSFWLSPAPQRLVASESYAGVDYEVTATPAAVDWDFGDGVAAHSMSSASHVFEAQSRVGYVVRASVRYDVIFRAFVGGSWIGPYPMGGVTLPVAPLVYPVQQAQPELVQLN